MPLFSNKGYRCTIRVERVRCFLRIVLIAENPTGPERVETSADDSVSEVKQGLAHLIHLPGLRGIPKRTYPLSALGPRYPGSFESYIASIIARAAADRNTELLDQIGDDLHILGLTWKIVATAIDDTQ